MSAEILSKPNTSKNVIKYVVVLIVFLGALWLSSQSEGPVSYTHLTLPTIPGV